MIYNNYKKQRSCPNHEITKKKKRITPLQHKWPGMGELEWGWVGNSKL